MAQAAASGEPGRQFCAVTSNSQSKSNQEHTQQLPAKREIAGTITAEKDTTTAECPGVAGV